MTFNTRKKLEIPRTEVGYFDCWSMIKENIDDFNIFIIIGGRRLGKTYSVLKGILTDKIQHMYVRRTDSDLDECLTVKKNPYRAFKDIGYDVRLFSSGKERHIARYEDDDVAELLGIASSISTSGSVRGAYLEDIEFLVYDEFINLKPVNSLKKKEGNLFLDLYDTANNDRDLRNKRPLKAILLSNANTTDDGIIRNLKLGSVIHNMLSNDMNYYGDVERKIYIALLPNDNAITNRRRKSAIGKLTQNTSYYEMAMNNNFTDSYFGDIEEKINYTSYYPLFSYENLYFYRHKSDGHIYVSKRKMQCPHYLKKDFKKLKRDFGLLIGVQIESGCMRYQNYDIKLDILNMF